MGNTVQDRIYQPEIETLSREAMSALQLEKLRRQVAYVYERVEPYRVRMDEAGVKPEDIRTLEDISLLPFTMKKDLRDYYPDGLFAVPKSEMVRVHASSGTTGKPIVMGYTARDVQEWNVAVARGMSSVGVTRDAVVQISYGYGLFTGGLGAHGGAEHIGAMIIPASAGNTARQLLMMQDLGTTHLCCTPSYALYLAESLEATGKSETQLQAGLFGAEAWSEEMRAQLEEKLHIKARDIYGLTEITGPGVSCQCLNGTGMHVQEDFFYPEIIDPDTLKPLPAGSVGELVFTTLSKQGTPLMRYRTRDITYLTYEPCVCGRTTVRMGRILGRTDDMLIIRGVNVFPSQIESVLVSLGMPAFYQIVVDRQGLLDTIEIHVELGADQVTDTVRDLENIQRRIRKGVEDVLGISAPIVLREPGSLPRSEGKAQRVIDKRKK